MSTHAGRSGVIYFSTSGSGTATNVIKMNAFTINKTTDKIEVTAFGDANKTYVQGLPDLQVQFSGFWDDTETKPFAGAASTDGMKAYLYPDANVPGKFAAGPAWLDCSLDTDVSGAVKISGNLAANGSWVTNL